MKTYRFARLVVFLLLGVVLLAGGCASSNGTSSSGAAPGTVWGPSPSGLPILYVFGDPS